MINNNKKIKIKKTEIEIRDLFQKVSDGNEQAFSILITEYNELTLKVVEQTLAKNDFHKVLSINYKSTSEELASSVWFEMYKTFKRGATFESSDKFVAYISKVSRSHARKFMKARIEIRVNQGDLINKKLDHSDDSNTEYLILDNRFEDKKSRNLKFSSIDDVTIETLQQPSSSNTEEIVLEEMQILGFFNNLTDKQKEVVKLTLESDTQAEVAKKMGVDVKTIFNILKGIQDKSIHNY